MVLSCEKGTFLSYSERFTSSLGQLAFEPLGPTMPILWT